MTTDPPKAPESGRWQFSLRTLFVGVAFVAVGCVALVNASPAVAAVAYTVAVGVMFVALLGILYRRKAGRAFWAGFAIFGWGYLMLLGLGPLSSRAEEFATTTLLEYVYNHTNLIVRTNDPVVIEMELPGFSPIQMARNRFRSSFLRIGHSLWTLLFAFLGGLLARYFYSTRADES